MKVENVMVTGANRGIGLEFVRQLSRLNEPPKHIFATYRSPDSLKLLSSKRKEKVSLPPLDGEKSYQKERSGTALLNLVANDLLNQDWPAHTSIHALEDDFVLVIKARTKEELRRSIQESIGKFITWADNNNIEVSPDKTNYILFRKWAEEPRIYWKGDKIKQKHAIKYLGVHIDDKLNWSTHLQHQAQKSISCSKTF
ncbi:hypothetical protein AVEN_203702-1 [Araneus ventricosus]|uniref:Reverse transcriptase domain-containing protein n=1 Tax=Araneus ventricosus TaxID=182803 RepID=A0A4Y2F061_ARAVE|nr:hypothetical protein AVEN_203702-1 [Araneus ventricosus]